MIAAGLLPAIGFIAAPVGVLVVVLVFVTRLRRAHGPACVRCGCTDDRACPGGCSWVSKDPPICSGCV